MGILLVAATVMILGVNFDQPIEFQNMLPLTILTILLTAGMTLYIYHFQPRVFQNLMRSFALTMILIILLAATKLGVLIIEHTAWATGTAVILAIVLTIAYDQRFAIGLGMFYCILASMATHAHMSLSLFMILISAVLTCCFSLREIRTRTKLLEVSAIAATIVFFVSVSIYLIQKKSLPVIFGISGWNALGAFIAGLLMQALLPLIEKIFRIATSMTLLDYSDANQPLLKRMAMEAPGTYSHSLFVGSIAEAAAEAIGANGLLCRVGAYYHDIGKLNKPGYFVENELGSTSRHKELSPTMSQLIIVGHVKDGKEMAKEYKIPAVLRQFIETHHGTTLVEYFFNEAKKQKSKNNKKAAEPSESEYRYEGPKPKTKEAAIVMLADAVEGAVRAMTEPSPTKIEVLVHNIAMKRLQDGQFDECDMTLRELSQIEASMTKTLAAHHHGRIAYPTSAEESGESEKSQKDKQERATTQ